MERVQIGDHRRAARHVAVTPTAVLVDTAVPAYAMGGPHPLRDVCRSIVEAAGRGRLELHASVEMVQEFVFHRMRRGDRRTAVTQARDVAELCILHDFDVAVLRLALNLISDVDGLGGRDAVHAATGIHHGIPVVLSPDPAFDAIPGLERLDPRALADRLG
jgi:uncharacterized protein